MSRPNFLQTMARLPLVKHILTIGDFGGAGGDKYSFKAPKIYGDFFGVTGVTVAPDNDTTVYKGRLNNEDFADGKAIKLKVRATATNTLGKLVTRDFTIVSTFAKAQSALAALPEKSITVEGASGTGSLTWDIQTARIPRRLRLS